MKDLKKDLQEDEIDLIDLARTIWSKKWFIVKITFVFGIIGIMIAFTSPKEFKVASTLIPEVIEGNPKLGGSLSGLASIAGVNLGGLSQGGSTINPGLYKSVAQSTPFLLALMNQTFFFDEYGIDMSLYDYYQNHYKISPVSYLISLPQQILSLLKGSPDSVFNSLNNKDILVITKDQKNIADNLKDRIEVEMDWDLNIVSIDVEMQDPKITAQIAEFTIEYITEYVTNYSITKSKEQLAFIEKQFKQKKSDFEKAQIKLATFRDRNTNMNSARAISEEERLRSEYNLAFNIYNQLAQQRESIKLQLNENTPVFTILEPVKVPVEKSSPKRLLILIISCFFGGVIGTLLSIIRK